MIENIFSFSGREKKNQHSVVMW